ncbi:MAG: glutaredoxin [Kosmotoga sp.]|nr:MAG: glutaredoxin [Kosmotoga sp.]
MAEQLLNKDVRKQVVEILGNMDGEVKLLLFIKDKDCDFCDTVTSLLSELTEVGEKVTFEKHNIDSEVAKNYHINDAPAIVLLTPEGEDKGVRFYGIPSGHEFGTLLQDIVSFSKGALSGISEESQKKIKDIDKDIDIKVFITPTCPYCPKAVITAHNIAMINDKITASMVEANEFKELSMKHGVSSVPHIVINDNIEFVGAYPEEQFVNEVLKAV